MSLILASFQRPRSQLSNDAGLGFLGVHQAELQTAFAEVCKSGAMGAMGFDPLRHLAHRVEPIKTGGVEVPAEDATPGAAPSIGPGTKRRR